MNDVTLLLDRAASGDQIAAEALLPLVYDELRKLASHRMGLEAPGNTLQPTALVHEAWLRVAGSAPAQFENRGHFFAAAAEAMRRILVESARRKSCLKRGGGLQSENRHEPHIELGAPAYEVEAVHAALDELARTDPVAAEVVKLRYFVGLTIPEVAAVLAMSPRTADRLWAFARVHLKHAIRSGSH